MHTTFFVVLIQERMRSQITNVVPPPQLRAPPQTEFVRPYLATGREAEFLSVVRTRALVTGSGGARGGRGAPYDFFLIFLLVSSAVGHGHDSPPTPLWKKFGRKKKSVGVPPPLNDFFRAGGKLYGSRSSSETFWQFCDPPKQTPWQNNWLRTSCNAKSFALIWRRLCNIKCILSINKAPFRGHGKYLNILLIDALPFKLRNKEYFYSLIPFLTCLHSKKAFWL